MNTADYNVPSAHSTEAFVCDCCGRTHVVLFDEEEKPLATFAFNDEQWLEFFIEVANMIKDRHEDSHADHAPANAGPH